MNVVVFFSGGASSLKAMLHDENYGKLYKVTGAYTDKEDAKGRQLCRDHDIPDLFFSRKDFYSQHGLDPKNWDSRRKFYEMLAKEIEQFHPDLICLSGYMHIVTEPLLTEYEDRILNVHPADLTIIGGDGFPQLDVSQASSKKVRELMEHFKLHPIFKGEHVVYDAIAAGETYTRSTVHIAAEDFDEGSIIVQSKPFEVDPLIHEKALRGLFDGLQDYSFSLQEKMKIEGDGPAYLKALEFISQGCLLSEAFNLTVEGREKRFTTLFLDNKELPYCGYRLG